MRTPSRALRVVLVIGSARPGGAEGQLVRLACELHGRGTDVRVLFLVFGGPLTAQLDDTGVPWEILRPNSFPPTSTGRTVAMLARLAMRLMRWQPDVVFAWLAGAVWTTLPLAAVCTRARRIAAFRGEVTDRSWTARPLRVAVCTAHAVTINAPQLQREAQRWGARPERIVFIPNGVRVPSQNSRVHAQPPVAVVVANFRWYKGHDVLIDALARVTAPLIVRLLGEGEEREQIRERAARRGVLERLVFVDHSHDVSAELRNAQFAIHPSRTEGLSNAILEELASGLPVIATDVGGTDLLVDDSVNGWLVPPGDIGLLAARISTLALDAPMRCEMGAAAQRTAAGFGWGPCTDAYLSLFARLRQRSGI